MALTALRAWIAGPAIGYVSMLMLTALVLGAGACLFDVHADDDVGLDFCFGMLAVVVVTVLLCRLLPSGTVAIFAPALLAGTPPHVLDPPPRLFF